MTLYLLLKGIILGFAIAAPVGPIGILCISRSLSKGQLSGFITGLGAASGDAIYGSIAAFGLTALMSLLIKWQLYIGTIGGVLLLLLGVKIFFSKVNNDFFSEKSGDSIIYDYTSTFFLTITNPMTILAFMGIFSALGAGQNNADFYSSVTLVFGVFAGSTIWWFILSSLVGILQKRLNSENLKWINRGSGTIIMICAICISLDIMRRFIN